MKKGMSRIAAGLIADVLMIALLAVAFTLPGKLMSDLKSKASLDTEAAISAIISEDYAQAAGRLTNVQTEFMKAQKYMMLFLNHDDIYELQQSIAGCIQLALAEDDGQIFLEMERIKIILAYLHSIEHFSITNLL